VEDYAVARLDTSSGATINLACSWKLPTGCDAAICGSFYGTKGGAAFHNVAGSFYDFEAYRFQGTRRQEVSAPGENWEGMAAIDWARRLGRGEKFDSEIERMIDVAAALDWIYNCAQGHHRSP
jgi:predicted dehydrogenase